MSVSGYGDAAGVLAQVLRRLLDIVEKKKREELNGFYQEEFNDIERDAVGCMRTHFGLPDTVPRDAGETTEANIRRRKLVLNQRNAGKIAKYILELEYGYDQINK